MTKTVEKNQTAPIQSRRDASSAEMVRIAQLVRKSRKIAQASHQKISDDSTFKIMG
ncbi:hypothetical protein [Vibrio splendidus]|uniref:hypothetical protein n=1 Tax=Vibrio splendidus TaxID=29497 RepID=UPI0012FFE275|nr:hypothetical protein [Vibrio splendidus]